MASWLFGVTADAARAAIVQTLKYVMITTVLAALTGGSFFAFVQYDLFETLGKITSKTHGTQKMPDAIEKEMVTKQKPPSTPSDIETSVTKRTFPQVAPPPSPSKPPTLDWKTEIFRMQSY